MSIEFQICTIWILSKKANIDAEILPGEIVKISWICRIYRSLQLHDTCHFRHRFYNFRVLITFSDERCNIKTNSDNAVFCQKFL